MNFHMESAVSSTTPISGLSLDNEWNMNTRDVSWVDTSEMFIAK